MPPLLRSSRIKLSLYPAVLFLLIVLRPLETAAREPQSSQPDLGNSFGITVSAGMQGILSFVEAGITLPKIGKAFFIEIKGIALSSGFGIKMGLRFYL